MTMPDGTLETAPRPTAPAAEIKTSLAAEIPPMELDHASALDLLIRGMPQAQADVDFDAMVRHYREQRRASAAAKLAREIKRRENAAKKAAAAERKAEREAKRKAKADAKGDGEGNLNDKA